ncbi:MAG: ABC transporter permease [Gemmatimonadetes bacterium]|nr:ABC transporter permease [Gemmatimonadota bacterium]
MSSVVWTVVRREYIQRVRSRWFFFATVGVPLLLVLATAIPMWLAGRQESAERSIVLVDRSDELGEGVARTLTAAGYTVTRGAPADEARLRRTVEERVIGAVLVLDHETATAGRARLIAGKSPSALQQLVIRQAVIQAVLERRLVGSDLDIAQVLRGGRLEVDVPAGSGGGMDDPAFAAAYAGSFILYMVILIYAVSVMRSVLEEKTSRIVEVIVSSLRPWQLMLGKILGVGAVGLTQLAVWVLVALALGRFALPRLFAARPELAQLAAVRPLLPGPGFLFYFLIFFLGGFFIYSALYAAVGAMCNSDEEAQQAQFPLMLLIVVPVFALVGVIDAPNSTTSVVLSLIPFFSPFLMFARAAGGAAPGWQIALSVVLMALTVVAVAWLAGRIYRVGILMTGKRPTARELLRWLREA